MSLGFLSTRTVVAQPRWLQSIRRTILVGVGTVTTCWQWLRQGGSTAHKRYQAEEERRRKHHQVHLQVNRHESRGSPGVPVDPAAMLMASYTGLAILPQELWQTMPTPSPLEVVGVSRHDLAGPDDGGMGSVSAAVGVPYTDSQRMTLSATATTETAAASSGTAATSAETDGWRAFDESTGLWRAMPSVFPMTPGGPGGGVAESPHVPPLVLGSGSHLADARPALPSTTPAPAAPPPQAHAPANSAPPSLAPKTAVSQLGPHGARLSATVSLLPTSSGTVVPAIGSAPATPQVDLQALQANVQNQPLRFELNQGQMDSQVRFFMRGQNSTLFLTDQQEVLDLHQPSNPTSPGGPIAYDGTILRTSWLNANPNVQPIGLDPLPGVTNYFLGNDPSHWQTNVPSYAAVEYPGIYPGVSLVYYGNAQGKLEYDFLVAPCLPSGNVCHFSGVNA